MNFRHAAALALVGRYLPWKKEDREVDLDCTFVRSKEGWQIKRDKYVLDGVKLDLAAALARELIRRATEWARENQAGYVQRQREDFLTSSEVPYPDRGRIYAVADVPRNDEVLTGRFVECIARGS